MLYDDNSNNHVRIRLYICYCVFGPRNKCDGPKIPNISSPLKNQLHLCILRMAKGIDNSYIGL